MELICSMNDGACDVAMQGQFTFSDHMTFREVLQHLAEPSVRRVVLHMQKVDFVDSAALGMLLLALEAAEKNQKPLILTGAGGQVKKMFDMARFSALFKMT